MEGGRFRFAGNGESKNRRNAKGCIRAGEGSLPALSLVRFLSFFLGGKRKGDRDFTAMWLYVKGS